VAGAERVFEIMDEPEEPADAKEAVELQHPQGHVVFENVSFGYRPDVPIIKDVNFEASVGSSTALVGPTGAGKTTIVNLLTRFYDVTEGRILLDGHDIRDYTRDSLRKCFGFVLQDTYLFSGTIKENIKYGKPDPEIYFKTAKALGVPARQCLVFEDSIVGIKAAKAAKMRVIAVSTTHSKEELAGADLIIENYKPESFATGILFG